MKKLILLIVSLLFFQFVSASHIYGDIYLDSNGDASFNVITDINPGINGLVFQDGKLTGKTSELTNKNKEIWQFDTHLGSYESILLDIHLPKNLKSIKSIEGVESAINFDEKIISLIDSNKALDFNVEYVLKDSTSLDWIYFSVFLLFFLGVVYLVFLYARKRKRFDSIFPLLNANEEKILKMLMDKPMRQKECREKLGFPKASFTRYLLNLEKKKLLIREGEGKNKVLRVK